MLGLDARKAFGHTVALQIEANTIRNLAGNGINVAEQSVGTEDTTEVPVESDSDEELLLVARAAPCDVRLSEEVPAES